MKKILPLILTLIALSAFPIMGVQGSDRISPSASAATDLINAVNALRQANGVSALNTHPILMQIGQTEADGIAAGMPGHWRPNNITLGQWLLSLGYPLAGDLSLDGYRSENWVRGPGLSVQGAIQMWQGDEPHLNTMLSPYRSDIGAGVATYTDEWGQTVVTYVLETALQTSSGQVPGDASPTLTALAKTLAAGYSDPTQAAQALAVAQYIQPVTLATARPDGDVIHEVKNGQSLWSIAITYGVKMDQIRLLNNLSSNDIYLGEKLLVQKGATQPVPTSTLTKTPVLRAATPSSTALQTVTPQPTQSQAAGDEKPVTFYIGVGIIGATVLGALYLLFFRGKTK